MQRALLNCLDGVPESRKSPVTIPHPFYWVEIHLFNAEALAQVDGLPGSPHVSIVGIVL